MSASSAAATRSLFRHFGGGSPFFTAVALSVPFAVFCRDTFYSLCRVEGSSMEPNLRHGDVLLVRKADVYPRQMWERWTKKVGEGGYDDVGGERVGDGYGDDDAGEESGEDRIDALRVMAMDAQSNRPVGVARVGRTWLHPPTMHRAGEVVVFRAPDAEMFPSSELRVMRVVGLGGQRVLVVDKGSHRYEDVPPFGLWVEGDDNHQRNATAKAGGDGGDPTTDGPCLERSISADSRTLGPISKNLVVGIAERVVWPPSRWGVVERIMPPLRRSWWPFL